jgi:hypothetical protein
MSPLVWRMIPNAMQFQPAPAGVSTGIATERAHSCPPEREARTAAEHRHFAVERAAHAGGQNVRAPSQLPELAHDNCLTFLAANGRSFLAPENHALLFLYQIRTRRHGIALAMMPVDDNHLASDTKPLARLLTLCATSAAQR